MNLNFYKSGPKKELTNNALSYTSKTEFKRQTRQESGSLESSKLLNLNPFKNQLFSQNSVESKY